MLTSIRAYKDNVNFLELSFADENPLFIKSIQGLGLSKEILMRDPENFPGGIFQSSVPSQRSVVLDVGYSDVLGSYQARRDTLVDYFRPGATTKIVLYSDDLSPRVLEGTIEDLDTVIFEQKPFARVSILSKDAYLKGLNPVVDPRVITASGTYNFVYDGDVPTGFQFDVEYLTSGGTGNWRIRTPATMGTEGLYYTWVTEGAGRFFLVNTVDGEKSIEYKSGTSQFEWYGSFDEGLNLQSVWPELVPGDNQLEISFTSGQTRLQNFRWTERFGGM